MWPPISFGNHQSNILLFINTVKNLNKEFINTRQGGHHFKKLFHNILFFRGLLPYILSSVQMMNWVVHGALTAVKMAPAGVLTPCLQYHL